MNVWQFLYRGHVRALKMRRMKHGKVILSRISTEGIMLWNWRMLWTWKKDEKTRVYICELNRVLFLKFDQMWDVDLRRERDFWAGSDLLWASTDHVVLRASRDRRLTTRLIMIIPRMNHHPRMMHPRRIVQTWHLTACQTTARTVAVSF